MGENGENKNWSKVSLKDNVDILTGFAFKSKKFNEITGIPLIRIRDLNTHNPVTLYDGPYSEDYIVNKLDILVGMDGEFNIVKWKGPKSLLNQRVAKLNSTNTDLLDENFMFYKMHGELKEIERITPATTVKHLSKKDIQNLNLHVPPIKEQRKIAAILSSVDEAIEKTEQIIEQTETVKKGLMQELFFKGIGNKDFKNTILGDIPRHWDIVQTGDLFENKSVKKHEHLEVLTVTQEQGVVFRKDFDMNIKFNQSSLPNYKKVDPGDFIISLRSFQGGLELSTYEGIVSPAYTVLQHKQNIDIEYFKYFLKSYWFIEQLKASTIGIRDGKQISYQDFKLIKIPLPPLKEQIKMSKILTQIDKELDFENNWQSKLVELKKGLMQELLTGKKRVKVDDSEEVLS